MLEGTLPSGQVAGPASVYRTAYAVGGTRSSRKQSASCTRTGSLSA